MLQTDFAIEAASVTFEGVSDLKEAVSDSDIIITITPSHTPLIQKEWVKPGTHFSCIGADMAGKEEIDSQIFEDAIVFVDDLEHCRNAGEIEIPLKQGTLSEDRICGELGDLILGKTAGRKSDTDITVFVLLAWHFWILPWQISCSRKICENMINLSVLEKNQAEFYKIKSSDA